MRKVLFRTLSGLLGIIMVVLIAPLIIGGASWHIVIPSLALTFGFLIYAVFGVELQ